MTASYPGSIKVFTTHNPGDLITAADIDSIQDETVAIETVAGINPQGAYASIAARLTADESGSSTALATINARLNVLGFQGFGSNYQIVPSVSGSNLTVAIKTLSGGNPSASDPVYIRINNTVRSITAALSVTMNAGTNWMNAGASETAAQEIDFFVYLGYNATDGVVLGVSRIPGAHQYNEFSVTSTNEKYARISTITNAAATDYYEVIGRFAATLGIAAAYLWSVPTYTAINLINRPIYETRWLVFTPTIVGFSANPTAPYTVYRFNGLVLIVVFRWGTPGTSNATSFTVTVPMTAKTVTNGLWLATSTVTDNGAVKTTMGRVFLTSASKIATCDPDGAGTAWTNTSTKNIAGMSPLEYEY